LLAAFNCCSKQVIQQVQVASDGLKGLSISYFYDDIHCMFKAWQSVFPGWKGSEWSELLLLDFEVLVYVPVRGALT
jgi:hypothetical protein